MFLLSLGACWFDDTVYRERLEALTDHDGDGWVKEQDCDDQREDVFPGGGEVPYDGVDQDCDGADLVDVDGDGEPAISAGGTDCDDADAGVGAGVEESWADDGVDNDCDGDRRDPVEWHADATSPRVVGDAAGGELGRRIAVWQDGRCLFASAPYADGARGAVYGFPLTSGVTMASQGGAVWGEVASTFLAADLGVSSSGELLASTVMPDDGAGSVYVLDAQTLCAGEGGSVADVALWAASGEVASGWFGATAAWLPDLDGDGLDELGVAAPGVSGDGAARGAAYLWFSPADAVDRPAASADRTFYGSADGAALEGITAVRDDAGSGTATLVLGQSVEVAGGAGLLFLDAVAAGSGPAEAAAVGTLNSGSTGRVFAATNVGDTDLNGADNLVAGVWTFGVWDTHALAGSRDESGAIAYLSYDTDGEWLTGVAAPGDVDGDGRTDVVSLAEDWPQGAERGQLAFASGAEEFGGDFDFSALPRHAVGGSTGDSFAYRAARAPDVDGDGHDELAVAAPGQAEVVAGGGAVYLVPLP
jgi:hypothetical protein